jgi:hypothetical protein
MVEERRGEERWREKERSVRGRRQENALKLKSEYMRDV